MGDRPPVDFLAGPWTVILELMSTLNPHPPANQAAPPNRLPTISEKKAGERPPWAEFALQEALLVKDDDVPADLAERHDEYALGNDQQS